MKPGAHFSKAPEPFRAWKAIAKSQTFTELFYLHILNMNRCPFIQEVSGAYTSPIFDTGELKLVLRV